MIIKPLALEKNNRHHHKISNGFTGYNGTCIGFNGNCNGPCWSLLVIGHLRDLLKPIIHNGICPETHTENHFFNG